MPPVTPVAGKVSDHGLADVPGWRCDAHCVVDGDLFGIGCRGLANVQGLAVAASEGGRRALQVAEDAAQRCPVVVVSGLLHGGAQDLDRLVGENRDEEVTVGSVLLVVEDRTQAEFGFQGTEDCFCVGQGDIDPPHGVGIPVEHVAAQAVDPGMGHHCPLDGLEAPGDTDRLGGLLIGRDDDVVVAGDTGVFLLQAPDTTLDMVEALAGARLGKTLVKLLQAVLEARHEALEDAHFLLGAGFGEAPQMSLGELRAVLFELRDHLLVDLDRVARCGLDGPGFLGVEDPRGVPRDHEIAVAVAAQPGEIGIIGNAAVHDDHRLPGGAQRLEHALESLAFRDIAGKDTAAPDKAAGVENQAKGEQRAVRAALLRMAPLRLGLICRLTLIVGVRQIIEGDRRRKVEQRLSPGKEMVLDLLLVAKQAIRGAVECHVTQGTEVDPEKFAQRTGAAQPPVGRPFRARCRHAGGDGGQCAAPLPPVEAEIVKQLRKTQHVQCCKRGMLDADRAPVAVGGRGDVDILPVAVRGLAALTLKKPRRDPACLGLDPGIGWHKIEHRLTRQQFLDALAQERPVLAVDREVPPEIEQGCAGAPCRRCAGSRPGAR